MTPELQLCTKLEIANTRFQDGTWDAEKADKAAVKFVALACCDATKWWHIEDPLPLLAGFYEQGLISKRAMDRAVDMWLEAPWESGLPGAQLIAPEFAAQESSSAAQKSSDAAPQPSPTPTPVASNPNPNPSSASKPVPPYLSAVLGQHSVIPKPPALGKKTVDAGANPAAPSKPNPTNPSAPGAGALGAPDSKQSEIPKPPTASEKTTHTSANPAAPKPNPHHNPPAPPSAPGALPTPRSP